MRAGDEHVFTCARARYLSVLSVCNSGNELEVVRTKTSFRVSRMRSEQNPDVRAARKQVR